MDGLGDLGGQARTKGAAGEQRGRVGGLTAGPREPLDREDHSRAVAMSGVDHGRHGPAGPAGPSDARGTVGVPRLEVAVGARCHGEVGDRGQGRVVEPEVTAAERPVGQEAQDLTPQAGRGCRRRYRPRRGSARSGLRGRRCGSRPDDRGRCPGRLDRGRGRAAWREGRAVSRMGHGIQVLGRGSRVRRGGLGGHDGGCGGQRARADAARDRRGDRTRIERAGRRCLSGRRGGGLEGHGRLEPGGCGGRRGRGHEGGSRQQAEHDPEVAVRQQVGHADLLGMVTRRTIGIGRGEPHPTMVLVRSVRPLCVGVRRTSASGQVALGQAPLIARTTE